MVRRSEGRSSKKASAQGFSRRTHGLHTEDQHPAELPTNPTTVEPIETGTRKFQRIRMRGETAWSDVYTFLIPTALMVVLQLWDIFDSPTHPVTTTPDGQLGESIFSLAQLGSTIRPEWPLPEDRFSFPAAENTQRLARYLTYRNFSEVWGDDGQSFTGVVDLGVNRFCDVDYSATLPVHAHSYYDY